MDRRERAPDLEEAIRMAFRSMQSRMWTALPGIVERFDGDKMIVDVQPTINGRVRSPLGEISSLQMPKLLDCPVLWQGGGGATWTFPIAPGDECLVIFASRCIDAWWEQGGVKDAPDLRMHNLSDGFAIVGLRSLPRAFNVSTTEAELRNDAGDAFMKFNPTAKTLEIVMDGGVTINGVSIDSASNVQTPATVTADTDVVGDGVSLKTHRHSGVQTGGGNTGQPI